MTQLKPDIRYAYYWKLDCASNSNPSLVPRPHPRREEKGPGYNTTSYPTLQGHNQHTIVSDHVITYAIYGILSMPRDRIVELITLTVL